MATKKTQPAEPVEEMTMEQEMQDADGAMAAAEPVDPWTIMVDVLVPRKRTGDDPQYYVNVNSRRFAFPANGKKQTMPQPIAEVLQASIEAEYRAEEYAEEMNRHAAEAASGLR